MNLGYQISLSALLALWTLLPWTSAWAAEPPQLRIGYQKASAELVLARQQRLLEKRFPHTRISWIEFPAGPQLLEALNIGGIDLGGTGDIPPLFAQAAGADLAYVGWAPPMPKAETILVPKDSPIHNVAQLKGKRVAFQKGSSAHNLLLRALAKAGLNLRDIRPVYLAPADARAAFASGQIDAWAIWDPWYSMLELQGAARLLANGEGLGLTGNFVLASRAYARANTGFVRQVLDELNRAGALIQSDPAGSAKVIAQTNGLPPAVVARTFQHRSPTPLQPLTRQVVAAQQRTADLFLRNGLLPHPVQVAPAVWPPLPTVK